MTAANGRLWNHRFILICLGNLFIASAFYALLPTLPLYLKGQLGFADGRIGLVIACFSITGLLIRPAAGYMLDNWSRGIVFLSAYFTMSVFFGGYAVVSGAAGFIVLRLLHGAAWGATTSSSATLVNDLVPQTRRGEGLGIFSMTMPLGMVAGPPAAELVMTERGAIFLFWSLVGFSLVGLLVCLFALIRRDADSRPKEAGARATPWRQLFFARAIPKSSAMCLLMVPYGGVLIFSSLYAQKYQLGGIGVFFVVFAASIIGSRLLLGRAFDRGHLWWPVLLGFAMIVAGLGLFSAASRPATFYHSAFFIGFGYGILMPTFQAMVNNMAQPRERGAANATYLASYDIGIGLGGVMTGLALEYIGYRAVYLCGIAFVLMSLAVAAFWSIPHYRRNEITSLTSCS